MAAAGGGREERMGSVSDEVNVGAGGRRIAVLRDPGAEPAVLWLGGFRSDMTGSKAEAIADWGRSAGRAVVRFDYSGHGASDGDFTDGTIGRWLEEATAVLDRFCPGRTVLVGSSMGGWIALLLAQALAWRGEAARLAGLVLVAPAPDFTERLMIPAFTARMRSELETVGRVALPSAYADEPTIITRTFLDEARQHCILDRDIRIDAPVHILQGMRDPDVPWRHAMQLVERLVHDDVVVSLIKDGDHRLSRPEEIDRLVSAVATIAT
jgi:pimeloyl-ACP methyl ester carboxylesterase